MKHLSSEFLIILKNILILSFSCFLLGSLEEGGDILLSYKKQHPGFLIVFLLSRCCWHLEKLACGTVWVACGSVARASVAHARPVVVWHMHSLL